MSNPLNAEITEECPSTPFLFPPFFFPQTSDIIYDIVPSTNITR